LPRLQEIVRTVRAKGTSLKATEQPIDTSTAAGKCLLDMLGCSASSRRSMAQTQIEAVEAEQRNHEEESAVGNFTFDSTAPWFQESRSQVATARQFFRRLVTIQQRH
jgi:hypothetical protein